VSVKDKEEITTAVTSGSPPEDRNKAALSSASAGGTFSVHKPGEGYATRLGIMAISMAYVFFAAHRWYYNWVFLRDIIDGFFSAIGLSGATSWMLESRATTAIAIVGAIAIVFGGFMLGYHLVYCKRSTADFLVKTDGELAKVSWPAVTPWFKPEAKVWGATYVVLIFVAMLALYVFVIDYVLNFIAQMAFYGGA